MKMLPGFGPTPIRHWLVCTLLPLFLTGCATTRLAEEEQPSKAEVLEVGYGTIDQDHLVGSVATVSSDEGQISRTRTMVEMLARLPGVQVKESRSGEISVLVRGARPLYVMDGMIFRGSLRSIDPGTVESLTVLKNAGETAIYGSRVGHGGVILIKTKTGSN